MKKESFPAIEGRGGESPATARFTTPETLVWSR